MAKKKQEAIEAKFRVSFANLRKPVNITVWCKDGYAITNMDNKQVLRRMVDVEQAKGTKIKLVGDQDTLFAIQKYEGKKKQEIYEKIRDEIKKGSGGNFEEK